MKRNISDSFSNYIERMKNYVRSNLQVSPIRIPELYNIKDAHQVLLREYVHVIVGVSKAPFFMSQIRQLELEKPITLRKLFSIALTINNPIRLITLRPLVTLLIETHIRKKLTELEIAYTQLVYLIPDNHYDKSDYLVWLERAKLDCSKLKDTVSSWKLITDTTKAIVLSIVGLILAFFGVSSVYELIIKLITADINLETLNLMIGIGIFILIVLLYGIFFLENTFIAKRSIFLTAVNDEDKSSVYSLENSLFNLVQRKKIPEFALDYFISSINNLIPLGLFVWIAYEFDKSNVNSPESVYINCMWVIPVFFLVNLLFQAMLPWINRIEKQDA